MSETPHVVSIFIDYEGRGRVMLDGKELNTTRVAFDSRAGRPTEVTLTVMADVQLAAEVEPEHLKVEHVEQSAWGQS